MISHVCGARAMRTRARVPSMRMRAHVPSSVHDESHSDDESQQALMARLVVALPRLRANDPPLTTLNVDPAE